MCHLISQCDDDDQESAATIRLDIDAAGNVTAHPMPITLCEDAQTGPLPVIEIGSFSTTVPKDPFWQCASDQLDYWGQFSVAGAFLTLEQHCDATKYYVEDGTTHQADTSYDWTFSADVSGPDVPAWQAALGWGAVAASVQIPVPPPYDGILSCEVRGNTPGQVRVLCTGPGLSESWFAKFEAGSLDGAIVQPSGEFGWSFPAQGSDASVGGFSGRMTATGEIVIAHVSTSYPLETACAYGASWEGYCDGGGCHAPVVPCPGGVCAFRYRCTRGRSSATSETAGWFHCGEICDTDGDCPAGESCKHTEDGRVCAASGAGGPGDTCRFMQDCGGARICLNWSGGFCAEAGCDTDADCEAGTTCARRASFYSGLEEHETFCAADCPGYELSCRADGYTCVQAWRWEHDDNGVRLVCQKDNPSPSPGDSCYKLW